MRATKLTYDQYVALVECGGKVISFLSHDFGGANPDDDHAHDVLHRPFYISDSSACTDHEGIVYYTLTE